MTSLTVDKDLYVTIKALIRGRAFCENFGVSKSKVLEKIITHAKISSTTDLKESAIKRINSELSKFSSADEETDLQQALKEHLVEAFSDLLEYLENKNPASLKICQSDIIDLMTYKSFVDYMNRIGSKIKELSEEEEEIIMNNQLVKDEISQQSQDHDYFLSANPNISEV